MNLPLSDQNIPTLQELLRLSPAMLARLGLACISLVCATGLPGAEDVIIPSYLARVKEWAAFVRQRIPRFQWAFRNNPADFDDSEAFFLMSIVVQVLKKEIGIHYNPARISPSELTADPGYLDSRDLLIHGPLGPTRAGTCNNIPMIVVAVAQELGFPVYLAATALHVYAKWFEPNGYTFNIEASNRAGMVSHSDEYYRDRPPAMTEQLLRSGYYLRPFSAVDDLALCIASRGWVLESHRRFTEAAWAFAHACRLAPTEPMYPRVAARCVGRWMRESYNAHVPKEHRIRANGLYQFQDLYLDPRRFIPEPHVFLATSLLGRYYEIVSER